MASGIAPINFKQWIDEHRHLLKPPVGNKQIWEGDRGFIVTVVGGPNSRTDYHIDEGEEFFYQVEGDITVRVMDEGKRRDVKIREGEMFLLPSRMPHSPRRPPNTLGLVIERKRLPHEKDGLVWFCENCGYKLYEEFFHLNDIETELQKVFERFYSNESSRTCAHCGTVMERPANA
ncbi:MAG: 3-hydroxyanthranilate 3,4-dioxygenase [Candidatus Binataceae bacterium]